MKNPIVMLSDEEVMQEFANFEQMAKNSLVYDHKLQNRIVDLLEKTGYLRDPYQLPTPLIYRSRAISASSLQEAERKFARVRDLSYANPEVIHKVGQARCNKAREAVFYGSNENGVPVFEVRPKVNNYVVVAAFRHKENKPITILAPVIGVKQIREGLINGNRAANWVEMFGKDTVFRNENQCQVKIDDLLSEWFVKDVDGDDNNKHYYRLTTLVYKIMTEHTYYGGHTLANGLIYPSVASKATGVNFAIKKEFIDENCKLFAAGIYQLEKINPDNRMELRWLKQTWGHDIVIGDDLIWNELDREHIEKDLLILGTDVQPIEFPSFNPDDHVAVIKSFSKNP